MKRMMDGKGERGNAKHRRIIALTKKQRSAAQCTSVTEETKADDIKQLAAHGGSTRATCPWLLLSHVFSAQVLVLVWYELLGCAAVRLETGWGF